MLYSLIFSVALAQFGIFQSPFKQLPGANNPAGMMIFSDGMDSKPAGQMMAAGMLPRYLPVSTDGYDAGDMWMYGFHGQTEQDVINAAKMRYPVSAAMGHPENMELLPLWSRIVSAGLNRVPASEGSAAAASASSGDAASSASSGDSGSFGPSTSASTGASASSEGAVSDGTASTDASTSSGSSTSTDSSGSAAAEPAVANGASTSADSGATTATDSGAASTDSGATTETGTYPSGNSGTATAGSTNGMPPFNPMMFDFEEFQERMKDMHENMAEGGFFPMQNGGATGNIMPFQGGATGNNMPFQMPQMPTAVSGNAAGSPAGHMPMPFFGQIEEAGDSESAMQGAAMGCLGMQNEASVLCMMKPNQAECNKCAIAGCVWSGSQCFATRMLSQPHKVTRTLQKAHSAKSNTNAAPTSSDYKPFMIGSAGIVFGALLGYAIGARCLSDSKSPLEEKILA